MTTTTTRMMMMMMATIALWQRAAAAYERVLQCRQQQHTCCVRVCVSVCACVSVARACCYALLRCHWQASQKLSPLRPSVSIELIQVKSNGCLAWLASTLRFPLNVTSEAVANMSHTEWDPTPPAWSIISPVNCTWNTCNYVHNIALVMHDED